LIFRLLPALWAGVLLLLPACERTPTGEFEGYIAGRFVQVAAPVAGRLAALDVKRGEAVDAGRPLFALEPSPEAEALAEAGEQLAAAEAEAADLRKGARPEELTPLAHVSKALQAARLYATLELQRSQRLYETKVVSEEDLNRNQSAELFFQELVRAVDAYSALVALPEREDRIARATAQARAAGAALKRAAWLAGQKR